MNSRALASLAIGAAVLLGTTGCGMIAPQATTIAYSAAEGTNVSNETKTVLVRNAFFVTNEDATAANLVASLINVTNEDQTVTIGVDGISEKFVIEVPAGKSVELGTSSENLTVSNWSAKGRGEVQISVDATGGSGVFASIPVLDGTLHYLEDAVPTPAPTAEVLPATPAATPTPSESAAAEEEGEGE